MVPLHRVTKLVIGIIMTLLQLVSSVPAAQAEVFRLEEATITDITAAFDAGALTCRQLTRSFRRWRARCSRIDLH